MSMYYGCSYYALPYVVARYVCRCGRDHTEHGALHVSELPRGWHETGDSSGRSEPECVDCHEKTVERRRAAAGPA
jgi:hypothetical protein